MYDGTGRALAAGNGGYDMKKGKLWGIGVGPGDPELLTCKAVRVIRQCEIIAVPRSRKEQCLALKIARDAVPELAGKRILEIDMPMTKDQAALEAGYAAGTAVICEQLDAGKEVGFLTLGDPTVYSTYSYLHTRITDRGYDTEIIPGVPSFCASAAALNIPLCQGKEELHIIPGTYGTEEAVNLSGVKVLMKNHMPCTLETLQKPGISVQMVENCGLAEQKIYRSLAEIPEDAGYYSLIIVKEKAE